MAILLYPVVEFFKKVTKGKSKGRWFLRKVKQNNFINNKLCANFNLISCFFKKKILIMSFDIQKNTIFAPSFLR